MPKPKAPTEYVECLALVEYLEILKAQGKVLNFSHTANETYTKSWNQKRKNSLMGTRKGVPDYLVVTNRHVLFIEMKRQRGGVVSKEQQEWVDNINKVGGKADISYGFDEAKEFIDKFI